MSVDMTQFLVTFYEESFEGLEIMESELLNLDIGAADPETINTIFRAAHSIKGGSGTFGLTSVASFTHVMETLLDEMRDGRREVTQEAVTILLSSVDVLSEMLAALRDEQALNHDAIGKAQQDLDALMASGSDSARAQSESVSGNSTEAAAIPTGWRIQFTPHTDMFKCGNDPVRMIRELDGLGKIIINVDVSRLPAIDDLNPEDSYLSWDIHLADAVPETDVREVFAWVEDECDLIITPITSGKTTNTAPELQVDVLEKTFNALAPKGEQLAARFYEELFSRYPQVVPLFKNTNPAKQQGKLLAALKLVVENLRNPETLVKALTEMGLRHQEYGAEPAHYDAVVNTLLEVIQEFAGSTWTSEVATAWSDALHVVATIMQDSYMPQGVSTSNVPANVPVQAAQTKTADKRKSGGEASSIRVSIDKVDELINTVGELVITQSMLGQFGEVEDLNNTHLEKMRDGLAQLERNTRELQEAVMRIRMLPISFTFQRFPRLVHDLSAQLGKQVELKMSGEHTELDKTVMEKIGDPLVHLVRNSMDHGIETPEKRREANKPETGVVHLNAYHQGGNIVIEIIDDGAGLNTEKILAKAKSQGLITDSENMTEEQINDLIFNPGFSTADEVSDVSGRGVGMDVVRRNIRSLGGTVDLKSTQGEGSTFTIRLPLTLAILDGQLVRVGKETYIIPLVSIVESVQLDESKINIVSGRGEVYKLRDDFIPIVRLYHIFSIPFDMNDDERGLLVVVEADGEKIALFVDELLGQQQVVIKSLETNFKKVEGLSGATILGDGTVALILDVKGLFDLNAKVATRPEFVFRSHSGEGGSGNSGVAA